MADETATKPEVRAFLESWVEKLPLEKMLVDYARDLARELARQPFYPGEEVFIYPEPIRR